MNWFTSPQAGAWLHGLGSALIVAVPVIAEFILSGNPFDLPPDWLKWIVAAMGLYNALLSAFRNAGKVATRSLDHAETTGAAPNIQPGDVVIVQR